MVTGIGRALALQLAASGSRLTLAAIDAAALEATVKLLLGFMFVWNMIGALLCNAGDGLFPR